MESALVGVLERVAGDEGEENGTGAVDLQQPLGVAYGCGHLRVGDVLGGVVRESRSSAKAFDVAPLTDAARG
jgi:hypothetical protein